ncbi:VOC family protein [Streptomyces sp. NPDC004959]|uniref:VOC family protein n=1 Tax=unclassified Streptomyces TaxID=2593676 RepID=UPI0033A3E302
MALRLVQVNLKARDDVALGRFWASALGWRTGSEGPGVTNLEPHGFEWPGPEALCLDLVRVPAPETVDYRLHLDLASHSLAHQREIVARLTAWGATPVDIGQGEVPWTVMADPEGNVFCVLEPRESYRGTGSVAAVVVDCADPHALAAFWGEAVGWKVHETREDLVRLRAPENVGPFLEFYRQAPGTTPLRHRLHLDALPLPGHDQGAEIARLESLGARTVDVGQGAVPWQPMADPEGNEFCVLGGGAGAK